MAIWCSCRGFGRRNLCCRYGRRYRLWNYNGALAGAFIGASIGITYAAGGFARGTGISGVTYALKLLPKVLGKHLMLYHNPASRAFMYSANKGDIEGMASSLWMMTSAGIINPLMSAGNAAQKAAKASEAAESTVSLADMRSTIPGFVKNGDKYVFTAQLARAFDQVRSGQALAV